MVKQTFFDNDRYHVVDRFPDTRIGETTVELWPPNNATMYVGFFHVERDGFWEYQCYGTATSVDALGEMMRTQFPHNLTVKLDNISIINDAYITFSCCEECCLELQEPILVARLPDATDRDACGHAPFHRHIPLGPVDRWVNSEDYAADDMLYLVFNEGYYIPYASGMGTCSDCYDRFGVRFSKEDRDPGSWFLSPYPKF